MFTVVELTSWGVGEWVQEGFAFAHCTECRTLFHLRANMPADRWWLRLKFKLLVVRDHLLLFIVVQLVSKPLHTSFELFFWFCLLFQYSENKIVLHARSF